MDNIFNEMLKLLKKEIQTYRTTFDYIATQKDLKNDNDFKSNCDDIENKIKECEDKFNINYNKEVTSLSKHIDDKKKNLDAKTTSSAISFMKYRDETINSSMQSMLKKIYAVRVMMDDKDDFLNSAILEGGTKVSELLLKLQHMLQEDNMNEEMELLAMVFQKVTGFPAPSKEFAVLYPLMILSFGKLTQKKIVDKTIFLSSDTDFEAWMQSFIAIPTREQAMSWDIVSNSFGIVPVNMRTHDKNVVGEWKEEDIYNYVLVHILNKYRESMPYQASSSALNKRAFAFSRDDYILDDVMSSCQSYFNPDGISTFFKRSFGGIMVNYDSSKDIYLCDMHQYEKYYTKDSYYYNLGGYIEFDSNMNLSKIIQDNVTVFSTSQNDNDIIPADGDIVYKRIMSSILTIGTWSIHAGFQHITIADNYNYQFCQNVYKNNPNHCLVPLIKPLTLSVAETNDFGLVVLFNSLDSSIASVISNLPGKSVIDLASTHTGSSDVSDLSEWNAIKNRLGPVETPLKRSLEVWWNTMYEFVSKYVDVYYKKPEDISNDTDVMNWLNSINKTDLKETITVMYFNNILHELFANPQLLNDLIEDKLFFVTRNDKPDGKPSSVIQNKAIETMIGTTGGTIKFSDKSFGYLVTDGNQDAIKVFDYFHKKINEIGEIFNTDGYLPYLHPSVIECSIAW